MKRLLAPVNSGDLYLRPLQEDDLPITLAWRNHESVRHWFKNSAVISMENHFKWFSRYLWADNDFVLIASKNGTPIAQLAVYNVDFERRIAEVGRFIINPELQGRGYMRLACETLLDLCSSQLSLISVYLEVFSNNTQGIGLYRRLGFVEDSKNENLLRMTKNL